MREVREVHRTVYILFISVPYPPSWYRVSEMVTEVMPQQGTGRGSAVYH